MPPIASSGLGKSTNSRVESRFLARIPSITWWIVRICEVVERFLEICSNFSLEFSIEKQSNRNLSSYCSHNYTSVVLWDSKVAFLGERKDETFHPFFKWVLFIVCQYPPVDLTISAPLNHLWPEIHLVVFLISDRVYFTFLYVKHNREGGRNEQTNKHGLGPAPIARGGILWHFWDILWANVSVYSSKNSHKATSNADIFLRWLTRPLWNNRS